MQPKALARLQMFVALWATTFIAAAHLIFYRGAGALWRDEVNSVNMATAPDLFSDLARYQFDSFPIGWFVVLRSWILCFAQWPDFNLRLFGLVVGMLLLGMAWIAARSLGGKTPTVSLVLFALSATTIRFGDSIRAYGLGMLLALATLVTYWRVCQKPGRARVWMAIFCGLLSVHFVFYNAVILFAITVASAALLVAQRRRGAAIALFAGGALAAASLLIYAAPLRAAASWNYVFRHGRGVDWFLGHLSEALNLSGRATTTLWLAAVIASIVVVFALGSRRSWRNSLAIWYCAITIAVALPAYIGFLYILRYPMPPWYFAVAMALTAVCLDGVLTPREEGPRFGRSAAILYVIIGILVSMKPVLFAVSLRQTTVDLAAESVAGQAGAGDLVLVYEWMNGITFQRYYRGQAAWET
ncbi:MAG TPA: hypothetical protein VHL58_12425, partial [Thermoanaerobaculia bacterium]|nr:hypothetical protein [Thermoanaerobaculia bacterium]